MTTMSLVSKDLLAGRFMADRQIFGNLLRTPLHIKTLFSRQPSFWAYFCRIPTTLASFNRFFLCLSPPITPANSTTSQFSTNGRFISHQNKGDLGMLCITQRGCVQCVPGWDATPQTARGRASTNREGLCRASLILKLLISGDMALPRNTSEAKVGDNGARSFSRMRSMLLSRPLRLNSQSSGGIGPAWRHWRSSNRWAARHGDAWAARWRSRRTGLRARRCAAP